MKINPVQQRAGEPGYVALDLVGCTGAFSDGVTIVAAGASMREQNTNNIVSGDLQFVPGTRPFECWGQAEASQAG